MSPAFRSLPESGSCWCCGRCQKNLRQGARDGGTPTFVVPYSLGGFCKQQTVHFVQDDLPRRLQALRYSVTRLELAKHMPVLKAATPTPAAMLATVLNRELLLLLQASPAHTQQVQGVSSVVHPWCPWCPSGRSSQPYSQSATPVWQG